MEGDPESESVYAQSRYVRTSSGLEFDRFANFADAIYAISLTLVVVGIEVPKLSDETSGRELLDDLGQLVPNILTFFIVFFVVGNYWFAHHRFVGWLRAVDAPMIRLQLVYLSLIAFLPFPAALLGTLGDNAVALAAFALSMAAASGLETLMIGHAHPRSSSVIR